MSTAFNLFRPAVWQIRCLNAFSPASSAFSTSAVSHAGRRVNRDRSKLRGVSAIRRQPKKIALAAAKFDLPEPVLDMSKHAKVEVNPDHGLWGFFLDKKALPSPSEDNEHGRAWTAEELRAKSWDDLHKLWWVCVKELNIMATQKLEHERLKAGEGAHEARGRRIQIKHTQRGIKHVLTERYYAWKDALALAQTDREIDLSGNGPVYTPSLLEEEVPETADVLGAVEAAEAAEAAESAPSTPAKPVTL